MTADVPATFDIETLQEAYCKDGLRPRAVVESAFERADADKSYNIWIDRYEETALARADELKTADPEEFPLYGIPFAVKDNINIANEPTTAACPAYEHIADKSATVVKELLAAGAILLGKTNMDQFATGLTGTRSPYGICRNAHDSSLISGGSSSGSGVAVARGQVTFALGTDTAGSGRVPAALNGIVGYKPTRGLISTKGIIPACRTLDCVAVFATTIADAQQVGEILIGHDDSDPYSRPDADTLTLDGSSIKKPTVGVFEETEHFGDEDAADLFERAIRKIETIGGTTVSVPERPFRETASLLYDGPWVAERLSVVSDLIDRSPDALLEITREIIAEGADYSAVDTFEAMYERERHLRTVEKIFTDIDVLLTPTTGTTYTVDEVTDAPIETNENLGYYTNYVNLLNLSAVAVPAGTKPDGAPVGVTFVGPAKRDATLFFFAKKFISDNCSTVPVRD